MEFPQPINQLTHIGNISRTSKINKYLDSTTTSSKIRKLKSLEDRLKFLKEKTTPFCDVFWEKHFVKKN